MKGILTSVSALLLLTIAAHAGPPYAIAVREINLNGNDLFCDSFNSADPLYSTDGRYDPLKATDHVSVGSETGIFNTMNVGNVEIWGSIGTFTPYTLDIGPLSSIGSNAWHLTGQTGIEPGAHQTDFQWIFPDVVAPYVVGVSPTSGVVNGVTYTYVLTNADYRMSSLTLSGNQKMVVTGQSRLIVSGAINLSGNACILVLPEASLQIYAGGPANLRGGGVINQGTIENFSFFGLVGNTSLNLRATDPFLGVIYASRADLTVTGSGSAAAEVHGAIVCPSLTLGSDLDFHYDEAP